MKQYILRRVGYSLLSLFLLSLVIFLFVRVTGDPVSLLVEPGASPEDIEAMRHQFGLDQPLWVQYWHFVASFLTGDLGQSFYYRTPVLDLYFQRLPNSLLLAAITILVAVPLALVLGIVAAMYRGSVFDRVVSGGAVAVVSVPEFLVATLAPGSVSRAIGSPVTRTNRKIVSDSRNSDSRE